MRFAARAFAGSRTAATQKATARPLSSGLLPLRFDRHELAGGVAACGGLRRPPPTARPTPPPAPIDVDAGCGEVGRRLPAHYLLEDR